MKTPEKKPPSRTAVEFGLRVRKAREAHGWSQEHLADLAGLHWSGLSRLERGGTVPTLVTVVKIQQALGVTGSDLLDGLPLQ